jgi:N-acetylmuramoyl-L-alanine amidase
VALGIFSLRQVARQTAAGVGQTPVPVVLLDAGHGGEDGGAVGLGGVVEKDINLPVTRKLNTFLRVMGFETRLTRSTDTSIHDLTAGTLRERKVSDIHNRFAMIEQLGDNDFFVSIHQNQFPASSSAHGTQVFYSVNHPRSVLLAQAIQKSVVRLLQPTNTRKVKPSGTEIYLLWHSKKPAVLVECGFLSNAGDVEKLQQDSYQNQMAFAIACGVLQYNS